MAVKRIVVTYDFTDKTYGKFYEREPGLGFLHLDYIKRNRFDQMLFGYLEDLGVDVDMIQHVEGADIPFTVRSLGEKLESADLIFHETVRVAFEMRDSPWRTGYQKAIENLVHSRFLGKSSFVSRDITYDDKKTSTKIARDVGIPIPKSQSVDEYFSSGRPLPAVLKHAESVFGGGVYFLDRREQIDKFFDRSLYGSGMCYPDKNDFVVQEFIQSPSDYYTHYRIFALGDGTILAAVLNVSKNRKDENERISDPGPFRPGSFIYRCVDSPVYLGCLKIVSNIAQGARQIPLDPNSKSKPISGEDLKVLIDHGYDSDKPRLHQRLRVLVRETAREFSKYGILFSGQDWIQDQEGNFFFLELNPIPGVNIFNTVYNKGAGDDDTAMNLCTRKLAKGLKNYDLELFRQEHLSIANAALNVNEKPS